jgi:endonuclease-3
LYLTKRNSVATELHYRNPYQLLVAVILSAQCTGKRVNTVTPPLFEAFPTVEAMSLAQPENQNAGTAE